MSLWCDRILSSGTARYVYDYKFKLSTNVTFKGESLVVYYYYHP